MKIFLSLLMILTIKYKSIILDEILRYTKRENFSKSIDINKKTTVLYKILPGLNKIKWIS